jgi:hypothetical protein
MGTRTAPFVLLLLLSVSLAACQFATTSVGELQEVTETVERQDARDARVSLEMGAGEMNVSGGARDLMEGTFTFNVESWRPDISYAVSGSTGELRVTQRDAEATITLPNSSITNRWDLSFTRDLPLEMTITLGAGENRLSLADLDVRRLNLRTGAGSTTLLVGGALRDLDIQGGVGELEVNLAAADWTADLDGRIRGGVGSTLLILPSDVGVRVEVQQGIGSVNATGLNQERSVYTNNAYGVSNTTLSLRIESGVGEVTLQGSD